MLNYNKIKTYAIKQKWKFDDELFDEINFFEKYTRWVLYKYVEYHEKIIKMQLLKWISAYDITIEILLDKSFYRKTSGYQGRILQGQVDKLHKKFMEITNGRKISIYEFIQSMSLGSTSKLIKLLNNENYRKICEISEVKVCNYSQEFRSNKTINEIRNNLCHFRFMLDKKYTDEREVNVRYVDFFVALEIFANSMTLEGRQKLSKEIWGVYMNVRNREFKSFLSKNLQRIFI